MEEEYMIGIHVEYEILKASDLNWIFSDIINNGIKEVRLQKEATSPMQKPRHSLIIDHMSTENSIDIM